MVDELLYEVVKDIDEMGGNVNAAAYILTSSLDDCKKYGEMAKLYVEAMMKRGQRRNISLIEDNSGLTVGELVDLLSTFDADLKVYDYCGLLIEGVEESVKTHNNYPYNKPDERIVRIL